MKKLNQFTKVINSLIEDKNLSDSAFRTLLVLMSFKFNDNKVFPSIKTIAKYRGKSKTSIINHLNTLRKFGYIRTTKRGFCFSNLYEFIGPNIFENADIQTTIQHLKETRNLTA